MANEPLGTIPGLCDATDAYTGLETCAPGEGKTTGLLLHDYNIDYSPDADKFNEALPISVAAIGSKRIYPISPVVGNDPSGGDISTSDVGFAGVTPTGTDQYIETYRVKGGKCLYKQLSKFNGRTMRVFRVDDKKLAFGEKFLNAGKEERYRGYEVTFYVTEVKGNGTDGYQVNITLYYSMSHEQERINAHAVRLDSMPNGLIGVLLKKVAGQTNAVKIYTSCGGQDQTSILGDSINVSMFVNKTGAHPTSATYNEADDWIALSPGGSYKIARSNALYEDDIYGLDGLDEYVEVTTGG